MILYNVTCNIDEKMEHEWVDWMINEHIPEVMATGKFYEYKFYKIQTQVADNQGLNFSIQYFAKSIEDYDSYIQNNAAELRNKTIQKYGDRVLAFRTILERIK